MGEGTLLNHEVIFDLEHKSLYDQRFMEITSNNEVHKPSDLEATDNIIDRSMIERQANELIDNRKLVETEYKNEKTYIDDARTLLFEALTASGHLSVIETSGTLQEIHATMLSVLLNSYSDTLPEHERRRRFQEICEEITIQTVEMKIISGEISSNTEVATISDYVTENAMSSKSAELVGYRASNKKGMVRSNKLTDNRDGTYTRVSEQISRSNANADDTKKYLLNIGVNVHRSKYSDVAVLGTQILHEEYEGVLGIVRRLDQSQGTNIRYGEVFNDSQISYEQLRSISAERERVAQCYTEKLAQFTLLLDDQRSKGLINKHQYETHFKNEVANILRAICVMDPSYAMSCFGKEAQAGFIKASDLVAGGDYMGATRTVEQNTQLEKTVSFCGMSINVQQAKEMGVEASTLAELIKFGTVQYSKRQGKCRVEDCPSRPGRTEVGPCAVCTGNCQKLYDKGWGYKQIVKYNRVLKKLKKQKQV